MLTAILLMVQKSGVYQLRLVGFSIFYKVLYIPGGCWGFLSSRVGFGEVEVLQDGVEDEILPCLNKDDDFFFNEIFYEPKRTANGMK